MDISLIYEKIKKETEWYSPKQLRKLRQFRYRMSQAEFADLLKVNYGTYLGWELGRYTPSSPALALLYIATHYPEVFIEKIKARIENY